jgi:hypothetical protein
MTAMVTAARLRFGELPPDRKYCLKIPGVLGGEYGGDNLGTISLTALVNASGHIAKQMRDLPDGSKVEIKVIDKRDP